MLFISFVIVSDMHCLFDACVCVCVFREKCEHSKIDLGWIEMNQSSDYMISNVCSISKKMLSYEPNAKPQTITTTIFAPSHTLQMQWSETVLGLNYIIQ